MTYRGVLLYNARDINSAGSVGNKIEGVVGLQRLMEKAASYLDSALFEEYWGEKVAPEDRLAWWLEKADAYTTSWDHKPSELMFWLIRKSVIIEVKMVCHYRDRENFGPSLNLR